jgi:hypothetical protein
MSDKRAAEALRSSAPCVLVEAPAGFGKTFQGAQYAKDLLPNVFPGRLLILTHTNAACDVFAEQAHGFGSRVEIRTIDSFISRIATVYHNALGLPSEVTAWATQQGDDGFNKLAVKVAHLLANAKSIPVALSVRYPYIICDEHQDSSEAQHQIILTIHHAGSFIRIFADPMQAIYKKDGDHEAWVHRWDTLQATADEHVELNTPHRWRNSAPELGDWIKEVRKTLKAGHTIDLRCDLPHGLTLIRADNAAQRHGQYVLPPDYRNPIDNFVSASQELLVLSSTNDTVKGLRAFFNRRLPIWEGHTRDALSKLTLGCRECTGSPGSAADVFIEFVQSVACGFSNSAYGNALKQEIIEGCSVSKRQKRAKIQNIANHIIECPDHRGIALALAKLDEFMQNDKAFSNIKLDLRREFKEAIRLAHYDDINEGLTNLNMRRTVFRTSLPSKVISTVHKAKGLERESVLIVPCDKQHFGNSGAKRRLLYVALSRATKSLALVVPHSSPSPLFRV